MGKFTNLPRNQEIALYSINSEVNAIWQQVEQLPRYRQRNIAKMLRGITNNVAFVLNAHGDHVSPLADNVDPLTQFRIS